MAQYISAKLQLKPLNCLCKGRHHDSCIVDQHVQWQVLQGHNSIAIQYVSSCKQCEKQVNILAVVRSVKIDLHTDALMTLRLQSKRQLRRVSTY
jgi:hypothetical protein